MFTTIFFTAVFAAYLVGFIILARTARALVDQGDYIRAFNTVILTFCAMVVIQFGCIWILLSPEGNPMVGGTTSAKIAALSVIDTICKGVFLDFFESFNIHFVPAEDRLANTFLWSTFTFAFRTGYSATAAAMIYVIYDSQKDR